MESRTETTLNLLRRCLVAGDALICLAESLVDLCDQERDLNVDWIERMSLSERAPIVDLMFVEGLTSDAFIPYSRILNIWFQVLGQTINQLEERLQPFVDDLAELSDENAAIHDIRAASWSAATFHWGDDLVKFIRVNNARLIQEASLEQDEREPAAFQPDLVLEISKAIIRQFPVVNAQALTRRVTREFEQISEIPVPHMSIGKHSQARKSSILEDPSR